MINTISDFMRETEQYFTNGFPNKIVMSRFAERLSFVKPSSLEKLFNTLIENFPSTWTPDVKALKEAIVKGGIIQLTNPEDQNHCVVCGHTWSGTGLCPECGYRSDTDGTPDEHRKWFESWKAGKEPRFDVGSILTSITSKNNLTEQAKKM